MASTKIRFYNAIQIKSYGYKLSQTGTMMQLLKASRKSGDFSN